MTSFLDWLNKNLFVALLVAGVALSCAVRFLLIYQNEVTASTIAIIICLLCLVIYYLVARQDTAGLHNPDNLYYMGLLFTLSSLVYSLITLFLLNNNESDVAERVYNLIGSFGIALISTFAGILGRILLLQKSDLSDPSLPRNSDEQRRITQQNQEKFYQQIRLENQNLNDTAFKLRMELTQTIADMRVFRKSIIQASKETVQEAKKAHTAMIQQVKKATHEQKKIFSKMSTGGEEVEAAIGSVLKSLQDIVDSLKSSGENIRTIASEYDSLNSSLRQSMTFFTNIEGEIEQASKTLAAAAKEFSSSLAAATEVTPQYTDQFEKLITTLRQEAEQWQSMTKQVRSSLVQAVEELTQIIKRS